MQSPSARQPSFDSCAACPRRVPFAVPIACHPSAGIRTDIPDVKGERPACDKCDWKGEPVPILDLPSAEQAEQRQPEGDCIIPIVPLKLLKKPSN
jgi:hypothetical protein